MALSDEEIRKIYDSGFEAVRATIRWLENRVEKVEDRLAKVEAQIAKTSRNSSKPPSSDGFHKPQRTSSLREQSDKKPGGQKGHDRYFLKPVEKPDQIIIQAVQGCTHCGKSLRDVSVLDYEKRQIFDLPPLHLEVTEHRAEVKTCPCCGTENRGDFPTGLKQAAEYGSGVKSLAMYLMHAHFMPYERLGEFFREVFGQAISPGSFYNFNRSCFNLLQDSEAQIKHDIIGSSVAHFDETGVNLSGKGQWLHSASTSDSTFYMVHEKRGQPALDAIGILSNFKGFAIHDHWQSYFDYLCSHGLCNAHHLRELTFLEEEQGEVWARKMKKCLRAMKASADYFRDKRKKLKPELLMYYENRYDRIVREGFALHKNDPGPSLKIKRGRKAQAPGKNMLDRLRFDKDAVLAFLRHLHVPFDNNLAERDIRMAKLKQKISGCFRSTQGAQFFCRIRGFISTLRKRNLPVFESIKASYLNTVPV
jgi:transposase